MISSPALDSPAPAKRSVWQWLNSLALLTPMLALLWMILFSKLNDQSIRWFTPHFYQFWMWDAVALAFTAWAVGLLARFVSPEDCGVKKWIILSLFLVSATTAGWIGATCVSRRIIFTSVMLAAMMVFYLGTIKFQSWKKVPMQLTIMTSAFLGAILYMALKFEFQSPLGMIARCWITVACMAPILIAFQDRNLVIPALAIPRAVLGGYIFAVGVGLAPGVWGGKEGIQLFADDQTLLTAMVVGIALLVRHYARLDEGVERRLLSRFIPLSLSVGIGLLYPLARFTGPEGLQLAIVLGASLLTLLIVSGFQSKIAPRFIPLAIFLCLLSPIIAFLAF